jgi:hypothetical protein
VKEGIFVDTNLSRRIRMNLFEKYLFPSWLGLGLVWILGVEQNASKNYIGCAIRANTYAQIPGALEFRTNPCSPDSN